MFTFKLINSSLNSTRLNRRHISAGSGRLLNLFKRSSNDENSAIEVIDNEEELDPELRQKQIDSLRNKSRLYAAHRNMLHDTVPYASSESWVHETLKYKRKMYAKFGSKSNQDPRVCFWTQPEIEEKNEYEKVAFPKTVLEMIKINEEQKREKREKMIARENDIAKNLDKLEAWKNDIQNRRQKRETDARVAKDRKDRLIDEVRRHFGYTIDSRDERFKELLDTKEKEQRKALKESKRKEKESKLIAKMVTKPEIKGTPEKKMSEDEDDDDGDDVKKQ